MICEKCQSEIENIVCCHCGESILNVGVYCYLCGQEHTSQSSAQDPESDDADFSKRVLCSDGSCIGVIDEKGVCKVCGKPYTPEQ